MKKRHDYSVIIIALLLIITIKTSGLLAIFAIFFSNIFFTAYSDAKVIIFLIFLICFFIAKLAIKQSIFLKKFQLKHIFFIILSLITILSGGGLASYIYATRFFNLPFNSVSVFVLNGWFDSTVGPFHIHTFKPVVTWWISLLGIKNLHDYGSGLNFYYAFSQIRALYVFGSICLLLTATLMIILGVKLAEKQKLGRGFEIVYCIFSFGILKSLTDGGPLWYETYVNIFLWLIIVYLAMKKSQITINKILLSTFLLFIVLYLILVLSRMIVVGHYSQVMFFSYPIVHYSLFLCGFGLCLCAINSRRYCATAFLYFIIGLSLQSKTPTVEYISYILKPVNSNSLVFVTSENAKIIKFRTSSETHIYLILAKYKIVLFRKNVAVDKTTCNLNQASRKTSIKLKNLSQKNLKIASSPINSSLFETFMIKPIPNINNSYDISYSYRGCVFNDYSVLTSYLKLFGFESYVLYY